MEPKSPSPSRESWTTPAGAAQPATAPDTLSTSTSSDAEPKSTQYKERAAGALDTTADKLRDLGAKAPGQRSTEWGHQAAARVDDASDYLRERTTNEMVDDARVWVRRNPGPAVISAAAFGFLLGMLLRRN